MRLLLDSHEREGLGWSIALSIVIHAILLGIVLLAYGAEPDRPSLVERIVTFLVPPDKPKGQQATQPADWGGLARKGTGSGTGQAAPVREAPAITRLPDDSAGEAIAGALEPISGDTVLTELEVDSTVQRYPESAAPEYPRSLLARSLEGSVLVTYVVDTTGLADTASFQVIRATHPDFVEAVRQALPRMRFRPAMLGGMRVRQLVQQSFGFRITRPDSTPPERPRPPGYLGHGQIGGPDVTH